MNKDELLAFAIVGAIAPVIGLAVGVSLDTAPLLLRGVVTAAVIVAIFYFNVGTRLLRVMDRWGIVSVIAFFAILIGITAFIFTFQTGSRSTFWVGVVAMAIVTVCAIFGACTHFQFCRKARTWMKNDYWNAIKRKMGVFRTWVTSPRFGRRTWVIFGRLVQFILWLGKWLIVAPGKVAIDYWRTTIFVTILAGMVYHFLVKNLWFSGWIWALLLFVAACIQFKKVRGLFVKLGKWTKEKYQANWKKLGEGGQLCFVVLAPIFLVVMLNLVQDALHRGSGLLTKALGITASSWNNWGEIPPGGLLFAALLFLLSWFVAQFLVVYLNGKKQEPATPAGAAAH